MVGELGFGGRSLGPAWRGVEPRAVQRVLCEAIDAGVELVDTSPVWGDSEALVGDAVRSMRARDRVVVATQVPQAPARAAWISRDPRLQHILPAAWVQESVESSLRATRLEVLPLVQLAAADGWHDDWLGASAWPELRGTMERLVFEGKVLRWGVIAGAAETPSALEIADILDEPVIGTIQLAFDLFDRRAAPLLARAARAKVGVIVRAALGGGALGGELGATTQFPPLDARHQRFDLARRAEIALRIARLATLVGSVPPAATSSNEARAVTEPAARRKPGIDDIEIDTVAELALRFLLDRPEIATVLVGMRSPAHLHANLAAIDGRRMTPALAAVLDNHVWQAPGTHDA